MSIYKRSQRLKLTSFVLSYLDSNQDKQNQNLLCYHYTIGQSLLLSFEERCKNCASESKQMKFDFVYECSQSSHRLLLQSYCF